MRRFLLLAIAALGLTACAGIDHPYDDPNRDECARQRHGVLTPNCPSHHPSLALKQGRGV